MSLVTSAHRNDLNRAIYMESVITHKLKGTAKPEELLSDVWKIHYPEAVRIYREAEREEKALSSKQQAARCKRKNELRKQLGTKPSLSTDASPLPEKTPSGIVYAYVQQSEADLEFLAAQQNQARCGTDAR